MMKRLLNFGFILIVVLNHSACIAQTGKKTVHTQARQLVWSDEFDYEGLPDSTRWDYEEGMNRGVQKQYYTRARIKNARVENGALIITARREDFNNPQYSNFRKTFSKEMPDKYKQMSVDSIPAWARIRYDSVIKYTSASIITAGKFDLQYGRVEVRVKTPVGKGISCAIWMLGTNVKDVSWPKCGEIDIMESVGRDPTTVHGTVHFMDAQKQHSKSGSAVKVIAPSEEYHIYAVDWDSKEIKFFCDGNMYHSFPVSNALVEDYNAFQNPFYLIMNIAIGSGKWAGPLDESALPQEMIIDYVRVYK